MRWRHRRHPELGFRDRSSAASGHAALRSPATRQLCGKLPLQTQRFERVVAAIKPQAVTVVALCQA